MLKSKKSINLGIICNNIFTCKNYKTNNSLDTLLLTNMNFNKEKIFTTSYITLKGKKNIQKNNCISNDKRNER